MNLNNIAIVAVGRALGHGWAYEIDRADGADLYEVMRYVGEAAKAYNAREENDRWPTAAVSNFELHHRLTDAQPVIAMETISRFMAWFATNDSGAFIAKLTDPRYQLHLRWGCDIDGRPSWFVVASSDPAVRREMAETKAPLGAITPVIDAARYLESSGVVYSDYHAGFGQSILSHADYVEFRETVREVLNAPLPEAAPAEPWTADDLAEFADLIEEPREA